MIEIIAALGVMLAAALAFIVAILRRLGKRDAELKQARASTDAWKRRTEIEDDIEQGDDLYRSASDIGLLRDKR